MFKNRMRQDTEFANQIMEHLDFAGVQDWGDSAVKIRVRLRMVALSQ